MEQLINQDKFLINFVPEQWDSVTKFRKFKYIPLEDNRLFKRGISTTEEHLAKFRTLAEIANELIPKLEIDENELKKDGYIISGSVQLGFCYISYQLKDFSFSLFLNIISYPEPPIQSLPSLMRSPKHKSSFITSVFLFSPAA